MHRITASLSLLLPRTWMPAVRAAAKLWFDYGHLRSVMTETSIDAEGQPVPWYTYPAIEYIKQLDFSECCVFEYGAGYSTLYWASVARRVVSVEEDEHWYRIIASRLPAHCELTLRTDLAEYVGLIDEYPGPFDVIVVDGAVRGDTRLKGAQAALRHLREGGMVILDNSDWLPESARVLREGGLIQVDMTGFAPISGNTQTTSFFLHRQFAFRPRGLRQPLPGPGAARHIWEFPPPTEAPIVEFGGEAFGGVHRDELFVLTSPTGPRQFRLLAARSREFGTDCAALLDVQRGRVLLSRWDPICPSPTVEDELACACEMSWDDFVGFVNRHPKHRYMLRQDGTAR